VSEVHPEFESKKDSSKMAGRIVTEFVKKRENFSMHNFVKLIIVGTILAFLIGCGEDQQKEYPHLGSTKNPKDMSEITRQNLQQNLVGSAYGNLFKIEKALKKGEIAEAEKLAKETRNLLLGYVDSIEESNLPDLEERAKNAIFDLDRMLFYFDNNDLEKVARHIRLCKIHLDSLRELTGLKRID
jgi:hypothetical protein